MSSREIIMAAAGSGGAVALNEPIIPILTITASATYLHLYRLDFTKIKTFQLSGVISGTTQIYHRYQNKLYVFSNYNDTTYYLIDLSSLSMTSHSQSVATGRGQWARLNDSTLIKVSGADNRVYYLNLSSNTQTSDSYTAGTINAIAQTHGTVTFYDRSSSGMSNFNSTVFWTAGYSNSGFEGEINSATYSGGSLGTRTVNPTGYNYSRNTGLVGTSSVSVLATFDYNIRKVFPDGTVGSILSMPTVSYGGNSYTTTYVNYTNPACLTSGMKLFSVYRRYIVATGQFAFILAHSDLSSGTVTSTGLSDVPSNSSSNPASISTVQINDSGYVVTAIPTTSSANLYDFRVFNGTTQVGSTVQVDVNDTGTYATQHASAGVNPQSEFAVYLSGSATTFP